MFSSIPDDWQRVPLSSVAERVKRRNSAGNTNVLTISAVHGLVNQKEFFNKIVASDNLSNYFHLKKGEFAYNKSYSHGYPVGVVRRLEKYGEGVLSPLYICFSMSSEGVDADFATYFFDSHWFIDEINEIAKEGARNHGLLNVGVGDFFDLDFLLPPLPEQQKIAAILSAVDDVIEKTRAQIDKLKDLKTGMMQELLTKGISPGGVPHTEFKDSPVGRIPVGWDIRLLGDLADFVNGNSFKASEWSETGYPIIRIQNLNGEGSFNYYNKEVNPKWFVKTGTLLFAWSGQRGKSFGARIWEGEDGVLNQHIFKVCVNDQLVLKEYLHLLMQQVQVEIERHAHGFKDSFMHVKKSDLVDQQVALPHVSEQKRIVDIVTSISNKLILAERRLGLLGDQKKALMQDLLTGKVRVNADKESGVDVQCA